MCIRVEGSAPGTGSGTAWMIVMSRPRYVFRCNDYAYLHLINCVERSVCLKMYSRPLTISCQRAFASWLSPAQRELHLSEGDKIQDDFSQRTVESSLDYRPTLPFLLCSRANSQDVNERNLRSRWSELNEAVWTLWAGECCKMKLFKPYFSLIWHAGCCIESKRYIFNIIDTKRRIKLN